MFILCRNGILARHFSCIIASLAQLCRCGNPACKGKYVSGINRKAISERLQSRMLFLRFFTTHSHCFGMYVAVGSSVSWFLNFSSVTMVQRWNHSTWMELYQDHIYDVRWETCAGAIVVYSDPACFDSSGCCVRSLRTWPA